MSGLVEVGRFASTFDATTAAALLESFGVESRVVTDNAGGAFPSLSPLSGGVRVLVRARDEARAREVLASEKPLPG